MKVREHCKKWAQRLIKSEDQEACCKIATPKIGGDSAPHKIPKIMLPKQERHKGNTSQHAKVES